MNTSAINRCRASLHENRIISSSYMLGEPAFDESQSQKYFETCFRIDPLDGHLINDIEVLKDPSTPEILKAYIQQHSCKVMPNSIDALPSSLDETLDAFDYVVPNDVQTASEMESYFANQGIDLKSE